MDKRTLRHKQNDEKRDMARHLKQDGETYAQIAKYMGVSRQRVQQLTAPTPKEAKVILRNANGICKLCHKNVDKLEIHHINYLTEEVIVVCTSCHMKLHGGSSMDNITNDTDKQSKYTVVRIHTDTLNKIRNMADQEYRSVPNQIEYIVNAYLAKRRQEAYDLLVKESETK